MKRKMQILMMVILLGAMLPMQGMTRVTGAAETASRRVVQGGRAFSTTPAKEFALTEKEGKVTKRLIPVKRSLVPVTGSTTALTVTTPQEAFQARANEPKKGFFKDWWARTFGRGTQTSFETGAASEQKISWWRKLMTYLFGRKSEAVKSMSPEGPQVIKIEPEDFSELPSDEQKDVQVSNQVSQLLQNSAIQEVKEICNKLIAIRGEHKGERLFKGARDTTFAENLAHQIASVGASDAPVMVLAGAFWRAESHAKTITDLGTLYKSLHVYLNYCLNTSEYLHHTMIDFVKNGMERLEHKENLIVQQTLQAQEMSEIVQLTDFMFEYNYADDKQEFLARPGAMEKYNKAMRLGLGNQSTYEAKLAEVQKIKKSLRKKLTAQIRETKKIIIAEQQQLQDKYNRQYGQKQTAIE